MSEPGAHGTVLRIAVAQPPALADAPERAKVEAAVAVIAAAGERGAQLLLFPEAYPGPIRAGSDYDAAPAVAEAARAARCAVCWSRIEHGSDGLYRTVAYVDDEGGERRLRYERSHPATGDVHQVLSGAPMAPGSGLGLADVGGVRVGVLICSELWLPEIARSLAVEGAEVLLAPAGGGFGRVAANWRLIARARAIENQCHVALTQALFEDEAGSALIAGPEAVLAQSPGPGLVIADADLERARWLRATDDTMREPKGFDSLPGLLRARRPSLYGSLVEPAPGLYDYESAAPAEAVTAAAEPDAVAIEALEPHRWRELRAIRIEMLEDAPSAFHERAAEAHRLSDSAWRVRAEALAVSGRSVAFCARNPYGPVGLVAVSAGDDRSPALLHSVYVRASHRGGDPSLASRLLAAGQSWAIGDAGREGANLYALETNERALRCYANAGFVASGVTRPFKYEPTLLEFELAWRPGR